MPGETNPPHGGTLIDLVATGKDAKALRDKAAGLRAVSLNSRSLSDLELLAVGGFSPLTGFMTQGDYTSVVNDMHLANGIPWSMPITLAVSDDEAKAINCTP
jgi:sulfate adenylyltransferase